MHPTLKGKGASPQQQDTAKETRWESDLAMPPTECSPTVSGSALISGVQNAQIWGGTFTVASPGSTHNHTIIHNYNYGLQAAPSEILDILKSLPLPNFRDIQLDTHAKATAGTCIWFTTGEMFLFWISNGKILWGIGIRKGFNASVELEADQSIAGAGKTVLA
jgi:hypothetical protein